MISRVFQRKEKSRALNSKKYILEKEKKISPVFLASGLVRDDNLCLVVWIMDVR